jgi:ABC-type multidrug transport system fused ATPase/permease subunit
MAATRIEALPSSTTAPEWKVYTGRRVVVHAPEGSYAARRAQAELREAERGIAALEKLVGTLSEGENATERTHIYLSDPVATLPGDTLTANTHPDALVRIVQPEAPGEPVAQALARFLLARRLGTGDASARVFVEGIAGVVAAQTGGLSIKEADDLARAELAAKRPVSIFAPAPTTQANDPGAQDTSHITQYQTSFIACIIDSFGASNLRTLISEHDPERRDQAVVSAYGKPLGALEEDWIEYLRRPQGRGAPFMALLRRFIPLIRPLWARQAELFIYMLLGLAYTLAMPLASKYLFDTAIPSGSVTHLFIFMAILFGIYILNMLLGMRRAYASTWLHTRMLMRLQEQMFSHLQRLPHSFYANSKVGDILTRLTSDLSIVLGAMSAVLNTSLYAILGAIGAAIALFALSPTLTLLVILVVPFFALGYLTLRTRLQKASYRRQELGGEVSSAVYENLNAHAVIKAFGMEKRAVEKYRENLMTLFRATLRLVTLGALFDMSTSLAVTMGQFLVFGVGGYMAMTGEITLGTLLAFFGLLPSLFAPIEAMADLGQTVQTAAGSLERVDELLDQPVEIEDKPDAIALPPLERDIRLENVSFSYGDRPILRDLNITIQAGTHVSIVGPSGSGKSTVVSLLARYWDPNEGRVLFDGNDLRDVTLESLRGQIGLVFQDTSIFDTTLRENIGLSKPGATDAEIQAAAHAARLESYVALLPAGYDTVLGERGVRMSGGQRQRLAIARALLRDPRILILDEATSALDAQTEREILDTLTEVARGRTTVSITHRLSFAAKADRILVLAEGRLVEEGTPAELLASGGLYAKLYREQHGQLGGATALRVGIEAARLKSVPLFSALSDDALAALGERVMRERYGGGEDIVRQGDPGDTMYIINKGQVDILLTDSTGTERRVNTLNEGDYFGEMALLAGEPRTATVRTATTTELYSIAQPDFTRLLETEPTIRQAVEQTVQSRRAGLAAVMSES